MSDLRKAAEMALEVMEYNRANGTPNMGAAIEALRQALAQPEQEPVAGMFEEKLPDQNPPPWVRDYKPKREWVGLTRRELDIATLGLEDLSDCYQAIEAKLKEKNT